MNFARIDAAPALRAFRERVDRFIAEHVTEEVLRDARASGSGFDLRLHLAMAKLGWVLPELPATQGGAALGPMERRILELSLERAGAPLTTLNTTRHLLPTIRDFGAPSLVDRVERGVAAGNVRLCMGLTESESGSDVAAARLRAERDDDDYLLTGTKPYVTSAHNAQYCFVVARSTATLGKHQGITIFLVPLDTEGVEIHPVRWISGERANAVHFERVRVSAEHRLGSETEGWRVLGSVLDVEHGLKDARSGLEDRSFGESHLRVVERALHGVIERARKTRDPGIDDPEVRLTFARLALDIEAARSAPAALGRVYGTEVAIAVARTLVDLTCPAGPLASCAGDHDELVLLYAWAQGMALGGGTTEVVRTIIAERTLGLPRPAYGPIKSATGTAGG